VRLDTAVGQTLRNIRQEHSMLLREASLQTLCSLGHLSDVERAKKQISLQMFESLAKGYGLSTVELLNRVAETITKEEQKCSQ
jgi:transcriptional regulator with XRE-family HTH domain